MAQFSDQLPCDGDGICMLCKTAPEESEKVTCKTCFTPWHVACLSDKPETLGSTLHWECPDCTIVPGDGAGTAAPPPRSSADHAYSGIVASFRAIEQDSSLTDREKAVKRQQLLGGGEQVSKKGKKKKADDEEEEENEVLKVVGEGLSCSFCMQLPDRPVTTPCGHNFCLRCFEKWIGQGKLTCAKCRSNIPPKMAKQPRINAALVVAIRTAKMAKSKDSIDPDKLQHFVHNQNRPDKPYTTERAKRGGKANAASGKIFVTTPQDYFGPILPEYDDAKGRGVLVGDCWEGRLECRQWGVHMPPVAGIAGQKNHGAQSVVLSGGYEDDEDHGEWFLYTGSGGRDLSGNKRTNKEQSFDQKFDSFNEALRVSCKKGYPVRVVRSHKEKRSSYAPEEGLRYDGIYRIEKCWQKQGKQGFKVCRYLFVRCDNSPAPWTSNEQGDKIRPLPVIPELKKATNVTERVESPSWDYDEEEGSWKWIKPPPASKLMGCSPNGKGVKSARRKVQNASVKEKILKGLKCLICKDVMSMPLTTPCGHNFCKACLEGAFAGQTQVRERTCVGGRTLRTQKNLMKCPSCPVDISEFLGNPQVNRELMAVIEGLKDKDKEAVEEVQDEEAVVIEDCDEDALEGSSSGMDGSSEGTHSSAADDGLELKKTDPTLITKDGSEEVLQHKDKEMKLQDQEGVVEESAEEALVESSPGIEDGLGLKKTDSTLVTDEESERASKRQKIDGLLKMDGAEKESKETQEARDGGIDSPSSTLMMQSDGELL